LQLDPNTYQELEALRGKLKSLQETIATHLAYLNDPNFPFTWPDLLNKFNMLTAKFATLSEDFYNSLTGQHATLPKLMLHPFLPTTTEQETNILNVLLRTKLIPDIEKLEAETHAAIAQEMALADKENINSTSNNNNIHMEDEQLIHSQLDQWKSILERHDRLAGNATQFVTELSSDHRSNFLLRYEDQLDEESDEEEDEEEDLEGDTTMQPATTDMKEWEKMGFPSEEVWKKWKLECLINFYSSGKSELVGSDLKKLATAATK
ncbi:hypothetical protein BDF20DRAFT_801508, partial [Mycotypha africana]|uniref:uncharacterized protein n=1 Tax=Mycotypha africana TaxID=64632 RepID=UPI002301EC17